MAVYRKKSRSIDFQKCFAEWGSASFVKGPIDEHALIPAKDYFSKFNKRKNRYRAAYPSESDDMRSIVSGRVATPNPCLLVGLVTMVRE
jgi:hypothetical protein